MDLTTIVDVEEPLNEALSALTNEQLRRLALQTRSPVIRDYLARTITHGERDFRQFMDVVLDERRLPLLHPRLVALLARIVATQRLSVQDPVHALKIFDRLLLLYGESILDKEEWLVYVDLLERSGQLPETETALRDGGVEKHSPVEAAALYANVELSRYGAESEQWLGKLNRLFAIDGLAPLFLSPGRAPVLDRLESTSTPASIRGPLVTVIVPTWNPGPWLWTAVRSLTQQTYADLEILVMDDHSSLEFAGLLQRLPAMDPRIRVISSEVNRGTYAARNAAVRDHAHGDFVTVQDDDDWSHPQRIERQVAFNRSNSRDLGIARAARVTEDMRFVRRGATFIRPGYPTTMMSRSLFADIGYWDPVRRNSDSEFIRRVKRTKHSMGYVGPVPLMLQRHREGSLSSAEVWEGYVDQPRRWQEWLSSEWYDRCDSRGRRIYMGTGVALPRPYAAPLGLTRSAQTGPVALDVLIVTDFGVGHPREAEVLELASRLLLAGDSIGLLHVDGPRMLSTAVSPAVAKLAREAGVTILSWRDEAFVGQAHIFDVNAVALCDSVESKIRAGEILFENSRQVPEALLERLFH